MYFIRVNVLSMSWGSRRLEDHEIPKHFLEENTYTPTQIYNTVKGYMVQKYGDIVTQPYYYCPEVDQLTSILTQNNATVKLLSAHLSSSRKGRDQNSL
jgi:hypothetical protein